MVNMTKYISSMVDECSVPFGKDNIAPTPAGENLLHIKTDSHLLSHECGEEIHMIVAKGLFVCRRVGPNLHPTLAVLCTRVCSPTEDDWSKLMQLLCLLQQNT